MNEKRKRMILGVVFYLFVCFFAVRGNLTYVSHVYILLLTLCFLDLLFTWYFLLLPYISLSQWSLSPVFCFLCSDESFALLPMHTVGGNKLFCFSFNEHTPLKKELYTIFRCTFFLFLHIQCIATLVAFGWSVFACC